jgi:hypothetical protein
VIVVSVTRIQSRVGVAIALTVMCALVAVSALAMVLVLDSFPPGDRAAGLMNAAGRWEVVWLEDTATYTELDRDKNYIVMLPATPKTGQTVLEGGHNILVPRGHIVMPGGDTDLERRAVYIKDATGTVRIEDLFIEGVGGAAFDAIAISAPEAVVELINIRVEGVHGTFDGFHGDIVQPFGGVRALYVNGLTGYSSYQGFYLEETSGPIGSVDLRNVNLGYDPNPEDEVTFLLWLNGCVSYPVTLRNVYIAPREGQGVRTHAVRPNAVRPAECRANQTGDTVWWPDIPEVDGMIIEGTPPSGDFVPSLRWKYDKPSAAEVHDPFDPD